LGDRPFYWTRPCDFAATSRYRVRATRLRVALALYQIEHDRPAEALEELVPKYLPQVPLDPFTGGPFQYRISRGEQVPVSSILAGPGERWRQVAPGQGVLWSQREKEIFILVPRWAVP